MQEVSVVIPNYNGFKFLKRCLDSLDCQTCKEFKIILVDNGSEDGSVDYIEKYHKKVNVIKLDKNYGFSKAVNEGIKASKTPFVILLNNDTEVEKTFVEELLYAIKESGTIFSCASKMKNFSQRDLIDNAGDYYCALGWAFAKGSGKRETEDYNKKSEIFSACAGGAIYRKSIMEKIGYFDEGHFAYLEDVDIGYRARIFGYQNIYAPKAVVYHVGSGFSGSKHNRFKVRLTSRNSVYLIYKNMPFLQVLLNFPFLFLGFLIKTLFFLKKGLGKEYITGMVEGLAMSFRGKKVKFQWRNIRNYLRIQGELWLNMLRRLRNI